MNIKIVLAAVCGGLSWVFGSVDSLIYALIIFMVIDFITGVAAAVVTKQLSSSIGARGILKKVMILVIVAVANVIDQHILNTQMFLRDAVVLFYIANEGISLLENATKLGLPVPKKIRSFLKHLHDHNDVGDGLGDDEDDDGQGGHRDERTDGQNSNQDGNKDQRQSGHQDDSYLAGHQDESAGIRQTGDQDKDRTGHRDERADGQHGKGGHHDDDHDENEKK